MVLEETSTVTITLSFPLLISFCPLKKALLGFVLYVDVLKVAVDRGYRKSSMCNRILTPTHTYAHTYTCPHIHKPTYMM